MAHRFALALVLVAACDGTSAPPDGGPPPDDDGVFMIAPPFSDAPEYTIPPGAPEGGVDSFDFLSTDGTHYTTDIDSGEPFTRPVIVWIPAQHVAGTAAPFIVLMDGYAYFDALIGALTTLIHERRIPPVVVVAIGEGQGGAEGERSFEYDSISDEYVRFVEDDILPEVESRYAIELTTDPEGRAAMGGSSGGAAAFTMGWFRPDLYRRILTYSGTFVNQEPTAEYPLSAWEYHSRLIAETERKPLRVFLEAGTDDFDWNADLSSEYHSWLEANRAMARVLGERGYAYRYVEAETATHVDPAVIRQTLPSALEWLWDGYPIP